MESEKCIVFNGDIFNGDIFNGDIFNGDIFDGDIYGSIIGKEVNINQPQPQQTQEQLQPQQQQQQQQQQEPLSETEDLSDDYNDDSFNSNDFTPNTKKRSYLDIDENESNALVYDIPDNEKWTIGNFNVSDYLFDYLKDSLCYNKYKTNHELHPARQLSLQHIYLFTTDNSQSCLMDIPSYLLDIVYCDFDVLNEAAYSVPTDVLLYVDKILSECWKQLTEI